MKKIGFYTILYAVLVFGCSLEINARDNKKSVLLKSFDSHETIKNQIEDVSVELSELHEENFMLRKQNETLEIERIKRIALNLKLEKKINELENNNKRLKEKNNELYMDFFLIRANNEFNDKNNRKFKKMTFLNNIKLLSGDQHADTKKIRLRTVQLLSENEDTEGYYYFNLAKAYEEEKNYKKAIENYRLAVGANSNYIPAYGNLGLIYTEIGNYDSAIKIFEKYIELSDNLEEKRILKEFIRKIRILITE